MNHFVIIALGSHTRPTAHIPWAAGRIYSLLANCRLSRTLWTPDIKGTGKMYMNQLACGTTTLEADELSRLLKQAEAETGRTKQAVTIDLDLMQYDQQYYHEKDWSRPYIQQLIPDIL